MKYTILILLLCLSLCTGCSRMPADADFSEKSSTQQEAILPETPASAAVK